MTIDWTGMGGWLMRSALGASVLLLIALVLMRWIKEPGRRQRVGEFALLAAVGVCFASLAPSWVVLPWLEPETQVVEQRVLDIEPVLPAEREFVFQFELEGDEASDIVAVAGPPEFAPANPPLQKEPPAQPPSAAEEREAVWPSVAS